MSDFAAERLIVEAINEGYGDRSTSPLDRAVASRIIAKLRNVMWMSSEEVALIVEAAGGEVHITQKQLEAAEGMPLLQMWRDPATNDVVIKSRRMSDGSSDS
jgi:hypothetical protein